MPVDHTSLTTVYEKLSLFAGLDNFWQNFDLIYGNDYDAVIAETLRSSWARGDFSGLPVIEVVSAEILGPAWGGYGASNNTIYLSESLLASGSSELIVAVLLEEIGHYVDALVNAVDTPGDEGELFALRVLGQTVDSTQLERVKGDDDSATITVNGETVAIEMATGREISTAETTTDDNLKFQGVGTGTGSLNHGVFFTNTGSASSTGTGTITIIGQGSPDGTGENNTGVRIDGKITSVNGAISVDGIGGAGTEVNIGATVFNGGVVSSTGIGENAATITINGQGSSQSTTTANEGVRVDGTNSKITSVDGAISITGIGGSGTDVNTGVIVLNGGTISSTGIGENAATITINGQGSTTATGDTNAGVRISRANSKITSVDGAITITGTGGSGKFLNSGVLIDQGGVISSTGIGENAATITIEGKGSTTATQTNNNGIDIRNTSTKITSVDGAISITGSGGSGTGISFGVSVLDNALVSSSGKAGIAITGTGGAGMNGNHGVIVAGGSVISSTAAGADAGTITINGQGSTIATGNLNQGVRVNAASITSVDGAILVTGVAGSGTFLNAGVVIDNGGLIASTGTGSDAATITINGQGSTTATENLNQGVRVNASSITSEDGAITINGTGGSGTDTNIGIALSKDASIVSIGKGAITITGIGGEGIGSDGIRLEDPVSRVQSNSGTINLIGTANNDSFGINLLAGSQIFSTAGDVNLLSKSSNINLDNSVVINTTGNVSINQSNDSFVGSTIIGANINISANTLFLNDIIKFDYNDSLGQFDIISVTGQLDLTGATLNLDSTNLINSNNLSDGISYTLINNDENDAVIGTFKGLAEGAKVGTVGDYDIFITYQGSGDNDVAIYLGERGANQAPTDVSLDQTSIDENVADNSFVGTFSSIDPNDGDTFTYSFVDGDGDTDNDAFTIAGDQLKIKSSPDFESQSSYNIRVRTSDQGGLFFDKELKITINNLDEVAPTITSGNAATAINENSGSNQVVYTVTSTDTGDIVTGSTTYSLKDVDDFSAFSINATSGQVKLIANPDFETKPNYSFTVVATDTANNFSEQAVTLTVNDLSDLGKNLTNKSDIYFGRMTPELIYALAGRDFVYGQGGNDTIYGGQGNDRLFGSLGDDQLNGEEGNDWLFGGLGDDDLNGGADNDSLFGDWGNDILDGGAGSDYLTGGFGADVFRFQFGESSVAQLDQITDFTFGIDKIGLPLGIPSNFSRAANSTAPTLTALVNSVFADANGAIAGAQALAINSAVLVRATEGTIAGTYLVVNDETADFDPVNDLVIRLAGAIGPLPELGTINPTTVFGT